MIKVIQLCFDIAQKTHALKGQNNIIEYNVRKKKFMQYVDTTNYRIWLTTKPLNHKPSCVMLYFKAIWMKKFKMLGLKEPLRC